MGGRQPEGALPQAREGTALGIPAGAEAGDRIGTDPEDADGLAGGLAEGDGVGARRETGTGAAQVQVGLGPGAGEFGERGRLSGPREPSTILSCG